MVQHYENESEIDEVVAGFESCTTAKEDFTHRSHLTVAVYYLHDLGQPRATDKMRAGLFRFLDHHGVGREKFHETLTIFWIKTVRDFLVSLSPELSLLEKTNTTIESLSDSRLVFEYYSEELLRSDEAKNRWLEPDLKDL
jgi:hypothetical protein